MIDDAFQVDDIEALNLVYDLIEKQNIILGGSSGINIAGAVKLAKKLGKGKNIVTILSGKKSLIDFNDVINRLQTINNDLSVNFRLYGTKNIDDVLNICFANCIIIVYFKYMFKILEQLKTDLKSCNDSKKIAESVVNTNNVVFICNF